MSAMMDHKFAAGLIIVFGIVLFRPAHGSTFSEVSQTGIGKRGTSA
jgi:hypothetical protein